jgi:hypothetical protein
MLPQQRFCHSEIGLGSMAITHGGVVWASETHAHCCNDTGDINSSSFPLRKREHIREHPNYRVLTVSRERTLL